MWVRPHFTVASVFSLLLSPAVLIALWMGPMAAAPTPPMFNIFLSWTSMFLSCSFNLSSCQDGEEVEEWDSPNPRGTSMDSGEVESGVVLALLCPQWMTLGTWQSIEKLPFTLYSLSSLSSTSRMRVQTPRWTSTIPQLCNPTLGFVLFRHLELSEVEMERILLREAQWTGFHQNFSSLFLWREAIYLELKMMSSNLDRWPGLQVNLPGILGSALQGSQVAQQSTFSQPFQRASPEHMWSHHLWKVPTNERTNQGNPLFFF